MRTAQRGSRIAFDNRTPRHFLAHLYI